MFENVDTHTHVHIYIRTTEAYLYYKLYIEPKGSGELIINMLAVFKAKSRARCTIQARVTQLDKDNTIRTHS